MHPLAVQRICESVERRVKQGDCPSEPPQSIETLEEVVLALWARVPQSDRLRFSNDWLRRTIPNDPDDEPSAGGGPP